MRNLDPADVAFVGEQDADGSNPRTVPYLREPSPGQPAMVLDTALVAAPELVRRALSTIEHSPAAAPLLDRPASARVVTKVQAAIGYLLDHPGATDKHVAAAVGCAPSTLASNKKYRKARDLARGIAQATHAYSRGTKYDRRVDGEVEPDDD
jgi:hypothetical protein